MELKKIQEILNQNRFIVPNYQRGYAWESEQVNDFLTDIRDASDIDEHYTGQIIVASKQTQPIGTVIYDVYEVVDGQQRLTTISIFIFCICNRLKQLKQDPERIIDNVIYKGTQILELNDDNNQFYKDVILELGDFINPKFENKSQKNLFNAKTQITNHYVNKSKEKIIQDYMILMTKFKVNFSVLSSHLEAGLVFETMNDRGIALNQMDMVKNYLIYLCSRLNDKKLANIVSNNYGKVFSELMKIENTNNNKPVKNGKIEDDFLTCSYFLLNGKDVADVHLHIKSDFLPKQEVIKKTKQIEISFQNNSTLSKHHDNIKKLANFLGDSSKVYSSIFNSNFKNEQVNEYLKRINFLGGTEKHSKLLLSLFLKNKNEQSLVSVLELIEVIVYRFKNQPNTSKLALEINKSNNDYTIKKIKDELKTIIQRDCPDKTFMEIIKSNDFYNTTKGNYKAHYFFYEYETHLSNKTDSPKYLPDFADFCKQEYKKFEIEHIEPQQPSGRKSLDNVNQLGNLVATFHNKKLTNKEFLEKIKVFRHSDLNIEKELINHEKWDEKVIKQRTDELWKFAKKRWDC